MEEQVLDSTTDSSNSSENTESLGSGQVGDNSEAQVKDTAETTEQSSGEQKQTNDLTSTETDKVENKETPLEKTEFKDPNMQAEWTRKTQELAEIRKKAEASLKDAEFYNTIKANKDLVKIIGDYFNSKNQPQQVEKPEVKIPEITEEDFLEASTNPKKFMEVVRNQAKAIVEQMMIENVNPLKEQLGQSALEAANAKRVSEINDFANENKDFWDLDTKGLIEPLLKRFSNTGMPVRDQLEIAYKLAKYPNLEKEAVAKAHNLVQSKVKATTDKGSSDSAKITKKDSRSWEQILEEEAARMKWGE